MQHADAVVDWKRVHFDHEKLDVYNAAVDFVAIAHRILSNLPTGHGDLADQLRRAATSIVLNIAEGAGEFSKAEKARFYRIARRSGTECAAVLDVVVRLELATRAHCEPARELLLRIVSMLTNMVRALHS
jgi:four helix bundle protein